MEFLSINKFVVTLLVDIFIFSIVFLVRNKKIYPNLLPWKKLLHYSQYATILLTIPVGVFAIVATVLTLTLFIAFPWGLFFTSTFLLMIWFIAKFATNKSKRIQTIAIIIITMLFLIISSQITGFLYMSSITLTHYPEKILILSSVTSLLVFIRIISVTQRKLLLLKIFSFALFSTLTHFLLIIL